VGNWSCVLYLALKLYFIQLLSGKGDRSSNMNRWRKINAYVSLFRRWIDPGQAIPLWIRGLRDFPYFLRDMRKYRRLPEAETISVWNIKPCLYDRTKITHIDSHYFYQGIWAISKIKQSGAKNHVDVGSEVGLVGMLSTITKVTFIDIRPFETDLTDLVIKKGSILDMPFGDNSVDSLSCLHVAEHIGLGRYGDPLNPKGTREATRELIRVLAPGGNLYFSVPVGKARNCFNAHRIHTPQQILDYFCNLELVDFSGVDDRGKFRQKIDPSEFADANYSCGLFHFTKGL
jgi:SAM-dependent methyltransferase